MKRFPAIQWPALLLGGLLMFTAMLNARAGNFTWSAPTVISSADATLTQTGTVVGAAVFGTFEQIVALTNGTAIDFKSDGSVATATGGGTFSGAFSGNTSNNNFNVVLTQASYESGFPVIDQFKTITLNNLTVGQKYSVQLFALDDRNGTGGRSVYFRDPDNTNSYSASFSMPANDYVIGTFTATNSTVIVEEILLGNGGNINALVIRQLSGQPIAPQMITQPQPASVYLGQIAQFTVSAYGTAPLTYQWQKSSVGGSLWTNLVNGGRISGATNSSLSISNLAASDAGDYQVIVSNANSAVTSVPATLSTLTGPPVFAWSPPVHITSADATLSITGTVVSAAVFGTAEKFVTLTNGTIIDFKADGSSAAVVGGGGGSASGAFAGDTGNANFNATLTQFNFDGGPKLIRLFGLTIGQQYTVQIFALDDRGGLSSAIHANFQDANDASDVSATIAMGDDSYIVGTFTATGTSMDILENLPDLGGSGNVNALVIRALGVVVPAQITAQPQSITIDQTLNASFTVAASGSTPFTYRWQKSNVGGTLFTNLNNGGRISGATGNILTITNLTVGDTGDYRAVVNNVANIPTNSTAATLSVQAVTPLYLWQTPAPITTADATLAKTGTIVGAAVFGPSPKIVVLTNGTSVDFKNDGSVATATGGGTFTGAFNGNTSNANFNAVLNQASYESGFPINDPFKTITLNNLVAGQQYSVQLFALDDRNGTSTRSVNYADPADANDYSPTFFMPDNVFTIATFTAAGSTADIQENLFGSGGNINALVVRRLSGLPLAPQITTQPLSTVINPGTNFQLTVGATGTSLVYQWQRATVGSGVFSNVGDANASGTATAQLTVTNATVGNTADYRLVITNNAGAITSSVVTVTVGVPPTVLAHRWSFNEVSGTTAVDSIGGKNGTLQGNANFNGGYVVLPNTGSAGDSSFVSIPGGLLNNMFQVTVQCWVTNNGWANGNTFVGFAGPTDPSGSGTNYNFINFFARWFNAISAFQIQTTAGDSGIVALGARVNYNSIITPPTPAHYAYTYDPIAGVVTLYTNGVLAGTASGVTIPLSSLGTNIGTIGKAVWNTNFNASIPGTSGNRPFLNGGISEVRIYNGLLSSNAIVDAFLAGPDQLPVAPQINSQPVSVAVYAGATAQFTVSATGSPLNYQWQRAPVGSSAFVNVTNGNASGMTTTQLTVTSVTTGNVADYRVIVSNGSGAVTSSVVHLTLAGPATMAHRWSFSEVSGTTAADSIGGANGTLQGNANFNGGYVVLPNTGSAGDSAFVSIPGGLLNNFATVSVECWVTNNGWANGNTFVGFAGPTDPSGSGTNYNFINFFARWFNAISAFQIQTTAGDSGIVALGARVNYNSIITPPTPAHYAYTYDPIAGNVTLYTNGVLAGTASGVTIPLSSLGTNIGTIGKAVWNTNFNASIPGTSGNRPFLNGGISEVRIYNGLLSSNAIVADFQLGPDQVLSHTAGPLSAARNGNNLVLSWPIVNGGFSVETSPVLGPNAVWTPVNVIRVVNGSNYELTLPASGATAFFRLRE